MAVIQQLQGRDELYTAFVYPVADRLHSVRMSQIHVWGINFGLKQCLLLRINHLLISDCRCLMRYDLRLSLVSVVLDIITSDISVISLSSIVRMLFYHTTDGA